MSDLNLLIGDEPQMIVVYTDDGLGICIHVNNGPHGLGLTLHRRGTNQKDPPLTLTGNRRGDEEIIPQVDASEVTITQYRNNEDAQAFKAWYGSPAKKE